MRIFLGGFFHETNTFSPIPTTLLDFHKRSYVEAERLLTTFRGRRSTIGGMIEILEQYEDVEIIAGSSAAAIPSGIVTAEAYNSITGELLHQVEAAKPDAVLLALHGAMYSEVDDDGDGLFLEMLRRLVGPQVPIAAVMDLHANMSDRKVNNADILVTYDEYPHVDCYEKAKLVARLLMDKLTGKANPVMAWCPSHTMVATFKETALEDYKPLWNAIYEARGMKGVLHAGISQSFYLTDSADNRGAALVITDGDEALAVRCARKLADVIDENRASLIGMEVYSPKDAYEKAMAGGKFPAVFGDVCDNPGAGGSCDSTGIIRDLLAVGAQKVAVAMILDPETVDACMKAGVGATIDVKLGGKMAPEYTGGPIEGKAYIKSLHDGIYRNCGAMDNGCVLDLRGSAVIQMEGITVIVVRNRTQAYDINVFRAHGIIMEDYNILVVKSSLHYKAAFGPIAGAIYPVEAPGLYPIDYRKLRFKKIPVGVYPVTDEV